MISYKQDRINLDKLGVSKKGQINHSIKTDDAKDEHCILAFDSKDSVLTPTIVDVPDIETLKSLTGIPDTFFDDPKLKHLSEIPPSPKGLNKLISDPYHPHICSAIRTYLYGPSHLVRPWEATINKLRFPMQMAVFAGTSITVNASTPLVIQSEKEGQPVVVAFDSITVEDGGQIIVKSSGKVTSNKGQFVNNNKNIQAFLANGPVKPSLYSIGGDGGIGANGANGATGGTGNSGAGGSDGKSSCDRGATNGSKGGHGTNGQDGQNGGAGGNGNDMVFSFDTLTGQFVIGSIGGNGGAGGAGGTGGNGGTGGKGGNGTSHCNAGAQGAGGDAGNGGNGGNGGAAGNGGKFILNYKTGTNVKFSRYEGIATGGKGGNPGNPGQVGGGSSPGKSGSQGVAGTDGANGAHGPIIINGSKIN